jgi:hypothetical protein
MVNANAAKSTITVAIIIAIVSIGGYTTIAGAFLGPNVALAKKSKHNSDDGTTSSSPSTPDRSIIGNAGDGYDAGKAAGVSAERSGQSYDASCPSGHTDAWCIAYHAGYLVGWNGAKTVG